MRAGNPLATGIKNWLERFAGHRSALPSLDLLLSAAPAGESLENRLQWLVDVVQWVRRPGAGDEEGGTQVQAGRLRRMFDVLDRNPEWKGRVAGTLRSIVRETSALDLFCATGLPRQSGLISETFERLGKKFLPPPPDSAELGIVFERVFSRRGDAEWVARLDDATLQRLDELLRWEVSEAERDWNSLEDDLEDALLQIAAQLQVSGGARAVRSRTKPLSLRELPFFRRGAALRAVLTAKEGGDAAMVVAGLNHLQTQIAASHQEVEEALQRLEHGGVSTEVVYQLAFIEASLGRFESLLELEYSPNRKLTDVAAFVALLVRENRARESLRDLFRQNFRLLTRKMVEHTAETGEHYIARTPKEYREMLVRAAGGGVIMAFTTWFKMILLAWRLPGLWEGLAASANYATGFVAIQLTRSTLATKQPANTAAALAARMHHVREPVAIERLVDEIVRLIRSQFASVVGNLALVAPTALAIGLVVGKVRGNPVLPPQRAAELMHSLSIVGPTIFYAAFTGVLRWASSMVGAGGDRWCVSHHIGRALDADRRLRRLLGTSRAQRLARFWKRNITGLASNISFGLMLGVIPELAKFNGMPLEIRHVTLAAGTLMLAVVSLGAASLSTTPFWLGLLGTLSAGVLNVAVSFALALWLAIRARGVQGPERRAIYGAILRRAVRNPLGFIFPTGDLPVEVEVPIATGEAG